MNVCLFRLLFVGLFVTSLITATRITTINDGSLKTSPDYVPVVLWHGAYSFSLLWYS